MNNKYVFLVVAVIVVIAGGGFFVIQHKAASSAVEGTSTIVKVKTVPSPSPTTVPTHALLYKDGTYDVKGNYVSPGGPEQIGVLLTIKDDKIADISVTPQATRKLSQKYQDIFTENYKPLVMGKNIDEVQLDKVSGSSLTPKGFNDAIQQIKEQAKV